MTICVLENFLRPYVKLHPHVWSKRLSIEEFAANKAINISMGYTPFFLNSGENPTLLEHLVISPGSTSNQAVKEAISRMKEALCNAKSNLAKAQEQMKRRVDKARRTEEWAVGDRALLSTRNLRMFAPHLLSKLKRRWVGPFKIAKVVSPVAFWLNMPPRWQIHPTFHASNLKVYIRHPEFEWEVEPPPPELVDGNLEYEVEAILRHQGKGARCQYLVSWKGYDLSKATWEPESHLTNALDVLADYLRLVKAEEQSMRIRGAVTSAEGA